MLIPLNKINQFYAWWVSSLLSCLPEKWSKYLTESSGNFDLVIRHQNESIIIMTDQAKILDSVPLSRKVEIDQEILTSEETVVAGFTDGEMTGTEKLISNNDPLISVNPGSVDFDLGSQKQDLNVGSLDLNLGDAFEVQSSKEKDTNLSEHAGNVVALNILQDEESTVVEFRDQTIQLLDMNLDSDEDTIINQNDQGNLLQFDATNFGPRDSTILFCNDDGKIRQVETIDLERYEFNKPDENRTHQFENAPYSGDSTDYSNVAKLLETYQGNKKCLYLLPDSKVFILNLTYPIEAIENIESVLSYDLEKHIPLSFPEIRYFYALNIDSSQNKVSAEVAVIKSEEFDLLNLSLEPFVKRGIFCTTEKFFKRYGNKINFLEYKPERNWQSIFKIPNLHLAFNWALFLLLLALPFLSFYKSLERIEEKSPQEIGRVKALITSFNSTNAESSFGSKLSEQINNTSRSVELLSTLSNKINSQAWLTRFTLKHNELKIKGEAVSATSVSDDLDRTGLFESIKFVSSIVKNSKTGKETFELLLILKSDA